MVSWKPDLSFSWSPFGNPLWFFAALVNKLVPWCALLLSSAVEISKLRLLLRRNLPLKFEIGLRCQKLNMHLLSEILGYATVCHGSQITTRLSRQLPGSSKGVFSFLLLSWQYAVWWNFQQCLGQRFSTCGRGPLVVGGHVPGGPRARPQIFRF